MEKRRVNQSNKRGRNKTKSETGSATSNRDYTKIKSNRNRVLYQNDIVFIELTFILMDNFFWSSVKSIRQILWKAQWSVGMRYLREAI